MRHGHASICIATALIPGMPSGGRLTWTSQTLRILRVSRVAPGFPNPTGHVPDISSHLEAEFGFSSQEDSSPPVADIWFLLEKKLHQQRFGIRFLSKCFYHQEAFTNYIWLVSTHFENLLHSCSLIVLRVLNTCSGVSPLSAHKCSSQQKLQVNKEAFAPVFLPALAF